MAMLRITALLLLLGLCHSNPPRCSYWKLWDYLNLTTSNTFVANVRPVRSWTEITKVKIEMILYSILYVDEKSQTVQGHTWTTMLWSNEFVNWNSSQFCGIDVITVPRSLLWIPDIHIQEDASDTGSSYDSPYVNLYPDGWAMTTSRQLLTFTCQLDLNMFPFDDQKCDITFSSMTASAEAILLSSQGNGTQLTNQSKEVIITQGEWDLKHIQIKTILRTMPDNKTQSALVYRVSLNRRPMLYVINFIIPLFYFLLLDLASFFINEERGEKLSFKITILLSISVLLLILKDMLPSTEKTMPWIANYCIGIFALVGISVLEAMTISFLLSF
ncbi:hypothetical protein NQD34_006021, partial [Periophthalmus magnuspinnatus]